LSLNVCNIGLQCNLRVLSTTVLQGSVVPRVNYGKIFNDIFIANLLLSVMVKEFWRSVRIRQITAKNQVAPFFPDTGRLTQPASGHSKRTTRSNDWINRW